MRILFCTKTLGIYGGIERVTIVKANSLLNINNNEIAICFTDKEGFPYITAHTISNKIKIYDLNTPYNCIKTKKDVFRYLLPTILKTRKALKRVIFDFKPDIIISTGTFEKYAIALIPSKDKFLKIREIHWASTYRRNFSKSKWKIYLSEFIENKILSHFFHKTFVLTKSDLIDNHKHDKNYDYMPNPSTFSLPKNISSIISNKKRIVLAVGRFSYEKNFEDIILIWNNIVKESDGWVLRIVGDGEQKNKLENLVKKLNLNDSIEIPGFSSHIEKEMEEASIYVMTSRWEGFPLVLCEAMTYGVPAISYDLKYGPKDIIRDGIDGIIVPYNDMSSFGNALIKLIKDNNLRKTMAYNSYERSLCFCKENIAERWMLKYNSLYFKKLF